MFLCVERISWVRYTQIDNGLDRKVVRKVAVGLTTQYIVGRMDFESCLDNRLNAIVVCFVDENKVNVVSILSSGIVAVCNRVLDRVPCERMSLVSIWGMNAQSIDQTLTEFRCIAVDVKVACHDHQFVRRDLAAINELSPGF